MDAKRLRALLERVRTGEVKPERALGEIQKLPFSDVGYAVIDHHRGVRMGLPEVVLGLEKTSEQIAGISKKLIEAEQNVLVTRVDAEKAVQLEKLCPALAYNAVARTASYEYQPVAMHSGRSCAVVTAGTSDIPVAEEAAETLRMSGVEVERVFDVGVAGLHRLLSRIDQLHEVDAIIVVAGMEGALPSVVGGLVGVPVVAVPTSVGYGASFGGLAALLGMLNSCASGVTVTNIDNGFGAAVAVARMMWIHREKDA
jgi:NCAIR mutase (PurE)-related protein